jgi:hypothetical protein
MDMDTWMQEACMMMTSGTQTISYCDTPMVDNDHDA